MSDAQLVAIIMGGGGSVVAGILGIWIKAQLSRLQNVDILVKDVEKLDNSVNRYGRDLEKNIEKLSGGLEKMTDMIYKNQKDIAVLESSVKASWKKYEELSNDFRNVKL